MKLVSEKISRSVCEHAVSLNAGWNEQERTLLPNVGKRDVFDHILKSGDVDLSHETLQIDIRDLGPVEPPISLPATQNVSRAVFRKRQAGSHDLDLKKKAGASPLDSIPRAGRLQSNAVRMTVNSIQGSIFQNPVISGRILK